MSRPGGPEARTGFGDPREARARASAEKAYRRAQRPWYRRKRFVAPPALLLLVGLVAAVNGGGGGSAGQVPAAPAFPGATTDDVVAQPAASVDVDGLTVTAAALVAGDDVLGETLCTAVSYANGTGSATTFSVFDWKLQDPNGTILDTGFVGSPDALGTGEIVPGGTATGDVCFDAPRGDPSGRYVVLLDPSFRLTSRRIAWLNTL